MRFAYIDSQGKEVTIPSVDALRLRIELKAIVDDTMFHDANSGRWAPAREHGIFRTLQRELEELDTAGFGPSSGTSEQAPPDDVPSRPTPGSSPAEEGPGSAEGEPPDAPAADGGAGDVSPSDPLAGPSADSSVDPLADPPADPLADAGGAEDLGMGVTLDLVPEDDMEPEVGDLDESAAAGIGGSALEGLEGMELAGDWGEEDLEELPDVPEPPDAPEPSEGPSATTPERFAMSPQDDVMASVPDPGLAADGDQDGFGDGEAPGEDADEGPGQDAGFDGDLQLEPGLAESFDNDALSAGTRASDDLDLESPLTDYDADQPPSWMEAQDAPGPSATEELYGDGGLEDPLESARAGDPADSHEGLDVAPPQERGEPPRRPAPRPRNAPPQRKLRKASRPGAGRLLGLLTVVAVVAAGGWYGFQALAAGGGAESSAAPLPELPPDLMPQMRQYAAGAVSATVAAMADLPEREAIPPRPDPDWLAGNYMAGAGDFGSVPDYWNSVLTYLDAVQLEIEPAFESALDRELASTNLTQENRSRVRERAVAGWDAAAADRQFVYDQLRAVATAALDLHTFVVANEDRISYEPATAGVSRDPVLEAVPETEEVGDAMWNRVGEVTQALDNLGYLETVTTEGLVQTFLDKLNATPIR